MQTSFRSRRLSPSRPISSRPVSVQAARPRISAVPSVAPRRRDLRRAVARDLLRRRGRGKILNLIGHPDRDVLFWRSSGSADGPRPVRAAPRAAADARRRVQGHSAVGSASRPEFRVVLRSIDAGQCGRAAFVPSGQRHEYQWRARGEAHQRRLAGQADPTSRSFIVRRLAARRPVRLPPRARRRREGPPRNACKQLSCPPHPEHAEAMRGERSRTREARSRG